MMYVDALALAPLANQTLSWSTIMERTLGLDLHQRYRYNKCSYHQRKPDWLINFHTLFEVGAAERAKQPCVLRKYVRNPLRAYLRSVDVLQARCAQTQPQQTPVATHLMNSKGRLLHCISLHCPPHLALHWRLGNSTFVAGRC